MDFDQIRYACLQCGKSCRQDWDIWLRPERVRENYLELFVRQESPFEEAGDGWRVRRQSGACASLDSDSTCRIHRDLSYRDKPYGCQQYPVLLVQTPDGLRVSASYTCTAVLEAHGPELSNCRDQVPEWLNGRFFVSEVGSGLPWEQVREMEGHFEELLGLGGWEHAIQRLLTGLAGGFYAQRQDHPATWWRHSYDVHVDWSGFMPVALSALLKPCFRQQEREQWERFDRGISENAAILIDEFGYQGSAGELLEWAAESQSSPDLERYRRSLWFRKQHLRCGGILSGMLMLWSVGPVFRVLSRLCGALPALERIELNLLGHTNLAEKIYPLLGEHWLTKVRATERSGPFPISHPGE